jgi:phosphate uptake regulator
MKNKIIEHILLEERDRLLGRLKIIERKIESLPSGWVRKIKKGNKVYKYIYQSKREGKFVKSIYIGKADKNIEKLLKERKKLAKEKKHLRERIEELNKILERFNERNRRNFKNNR